LSKDLRNTFCIQSKNFFKNYSLIFDFDLRLSV
jgi:hypothetical protein